MRVVEGMPAVKFERRRPQVGENPFPTDQAWPTGGLVSARDPPVFVVLYT
jgi:hypothetical protein